MDGDGSNVSLTVLLSLISSVFTAITVLFEEAFAESTPGENVEFRATIEAHSVGRKLARLPREDLHAFAQNKHRFRNVARALCVDLGLELSQVHLGYTALKGSGCVVYGLIAAAAAKGVSKLERRTYDCIWFDIFGANSQINGCFELLLPVSTKAADKGDIGNVDDTCIEDFYAKHGEFWKSATRKLFRVGFEAAVKICAPIAGEMAQLTTDGKQ